jgi:hypothetical protein
MAGLEPTIPWSQATWGAAPLHPVFQSERLDLNQRSPGPQPGAIPGFATLCRHRMTRVGFEPNLASLKDWQPHQKSNGPYVWTYLPRDPTNRIVLNVGWKALESFSPGLQPGATPSQLPAQTKEKARCPLCDTGLLKARGGLEPMSRAQGIEGLLASQTCTSRKPSKVLPGFGIHELRGESIRWVSELPRISLWAIGHQPGKHHDPQDLRTGFFRVIVTRGRQPPSQLP